MKLTFVTSVVAIALAAQVAPAQTKMIANVPFEFKAGDTRLPAGEYMIAKAHNSILVLRNMSTQQSIVQVGSPQSSVTAPEKGKLVFNRRGDAYFLHQVWAVGESNGCALKTSKREAEMSRAAKERETVVVVAKR